MSEHTKARTERLLAITHGQLVLHAQDLTRQLDELLAALEPLRLKFQSGNHVPVERAVIKSNEWQPVEAAISSVKGGA